MARYVITVESDEPIDKTDIALPKGASLIALTKSAPGRVDAAWFGRLCEQILHYERRELDETSRNWLKMALSHGWDNAKLWRKIYLSANDPEADIRRLGMFISKYDRKVL